MKWIAIAPALLALSASVPAQARSHRRSAAASPSGHERAISELSGKFKWGMSAESCMKLVAGQIHDRYVTMIKNEADVYKQDQLRKDEKADIQKVHDSYVKFDGVNPTNQAWRTSIVQNEFALRNGESMLTVWEKDQRRFLFFWHDRLYKQYIALNADHPAIAGKSFDDFAKVIQNRYGAAEMKFAPLKTSDDMKLDHLEWPASGNYQLFAIDQSEFYGNYCLVLFNPKVAKQVEAARAAHAPPVVRGNALIDAVTKPETSTNDGNENIVDQITGAATHRR